MFPTVSLEERGSVSWHSRRRGEGEEKGGSTGYTTSGLAHGVRDTSENCREYVVSSLFVIGSCKERGQIEGV